MAKSQCVECGVSVVADSFCRVCGLPVCSACSRNCGCVPDRPEGGLMTHAARERALAGSGGKVMEPREGVRMRRAREKALRERPGEGPAMWD